MYIYIFAGPSAQSVIHHSCSSLLFVNPLYSPEASVTSRLGLVRALLGLSRAPSRIPRAPWDDLENHRFH